MKEIRACGRKLGVLFALALTSASAAAEPVAVRYPETITHAFLTLRGANDEVIAYGELVQAPVKGSACRPASCSGSRTAPSGTRR
jgi:hypothetical protein